MRPAGADAPQDELLAQLIVVLAIDHRQAQHERAAGQVNVFDVELVVVLSVGELAAIGIALRADWRVLVDRYRVGLAVLEQRSEGAIDVHAGNHDPAFDVRQRLQCDLGVSSAQSPTVDYRIRSEGRELIAMRCQLGPVAVEVGNLWEVAGLELAAMHDKQLIARRGELLDDRAADEPRAAEKDHPHPATGVTTCGFFSTIRSIRPHSLACSGVMKKSRSIARSTSSSCRLQCFA